MGAALQCVYAVQQHELAHMSCTVRSCSILLSEALAPGRLDASVRVPQLLGWSGMKGWQVQASGRCSRQPN